MKKYLMCSVFSFITVITTYLSLFYYQLGTVNTGTYDLRWIAEYQKVKRQNAAIISQPKLIIMAGSGSHFGISAKLLNKELGIPAINMSLQAGLTLDYLLQEAKKYSKSGDTILLALEYEYYHYNGKPNETYLNYVSSYDPKYFVSQPLNKQFSDAFYYGWKKVVKGIILKFQGNPNNHQTLTKGCYSGVTINQWGDETCNQKSEMNQKHFDAINKLAPVFMKINKDAKTWELLKEFSEYCHKNNIQLLATFPNTIYFPEYRQNNHREFLEYVIKFYQQNGIPVVGNPYEFMYDKTMFFDTGYHVNNIGTEKHTKQLIHLLDHTFH